MFGDLSRALAENLRACRAALGLTQEQVAERSGLHRTYIGAIERCEANVTLAVVEQLADAIEVEALRMLAPMGDQHG